MDPANAALRLAIAPAPNKGLKQTNQQRRMSRERLQAASNAVFSNPDLVGTILTNNVGPVAFATASQINQQSQVT